MKEERVINAEEFESFNFDNVYSYYNGKRGCMCGCCGSYSYSSKHREYMHQIIEVM